MHIAIAFPVVALASLAATSPDSGTPGDFSAVPFGIASLIGGGSATPMYTPQLVDGRDDTAVNVPAGESIQVEWRHPRDVHLIRLVFPDPAPPAENITIKYWYNVWPDNGGGGWMKVDDPFRGGFVVAAAEVKRAGANTIEFRVKPLDKAENPKIKETGFNWRRTYRIAASFKVPARIAEIECVTDSRWKEATLKFELVGQDWGGRLEARNARILSTSSIDRSSVAVKVRYADNPERLSPDRGHIFVRRSGKGTDFAFFVDDVLRDGGLFVRDIKAFISDASKNLSYSTWHAPSESWDATVREKVATMPEQTLKRATTEIPPKWIPHAHMGLPNLRQEISIDDASQIYTEFRSLRSPGPDRDRSPSLSLEHSERKYTRITRTKPFAPPGPKRIKRWLEEGYLPIIHSRWQDDNINYYQTIFVTALDPAVLKASLALPTPASRAFGLADRAANFGSGLRGDEPVAALARIEIENPAEMEQTATMWLKLTGRPNLQITKDGLLVLDKPTRPSAGPGLTPVWGQIDTRGKGELVCLNDPPPEQPELRDAIRYSLRLAPHEKHAIFMKVPYIEQMTTAELSQFKGLDWSTALPEVAQRWKERLAKAMTNYQVPEPALMNLYCANFWHVLITTDRDPPTGLYEHGAGTYEYPMYANEAMMVARSLEMRGEHEEARRLFEPCLVSQGAKPLPGNFKSQEGLLYAAAPKGYDYYTAQGYNMHHGFILWAVAEHYLWTRDKQYLQTVAPSLVSACDWITRERKATMILDPDGRKPLEWGLAPAGDLEDIDEYLYWYATNAYYYLGMKTAADVLAEIHHPEAPRLAADAAAYAADIMVSVHESVASSPVVKLLNGVYIPYAPPRLHALTDRKEGWIREALYCALHLVDCGLVRPDDQLTTWILDVLEDRLFMSPESGFGPQHGLKNPKEQFFSWGGFNPQPNLLDNSIAYLKRGQIHNFMRAFFNTYAMSIYPDVQCFAESVSFGMGGGPLYKTPDESKFIQWMRQMLVLEVDNDLYIGRGVPRAWMADGKCVILREAPTYFGPMDMQITSAVATNRIRAELNLPTRNPAKSVHLSLRHPDGKKFKSVRVNEQPWKDADPATETVTLPGTAGKLSVVAMY